jgi:hypothetical protein
VRHEKFHLTYRTMRRGCLLDGVQIYFDKMTQISSTTEKVISRNYSPNILCGNVLFKKEQRQRRDTCATTYVLSIREDIVPRPVEVIAWRIRIGPSAIRYNEHFCPRLHYLRVSLKVRGKAPLRTWMPDLS